MNKLFYLTIICMVLLVGNVTSFELNPFAEVKIYEKDPTDTQFSKQEYNDKYGVIKISDTFLWVQTDKLAEYSLISNTDNCFINCKAKGKVILYQDGIIFQDVNFKDRLNKDTSILESQFYVLLDVNYSEKIQDKIEILTHVNGTKYNNVLIWKTITKQKKEWVEYNGQTLSAGKYEWKLEGTKKPYQTVDWIASAFGNEFTEWAIWEGENVNAEVFTSNGTFVTPPGITLVRVLCVAGGGGGGSEQDGGGGGAGGIIYNQSVPVSGSIDVVVGLGGQGAIPGALEVIGFHGGNSSFGTLECFGGGGGMKSTGADCPENWEIDGGNGGGGGSCAGGRGVQPGLGFQSQGLRGGAAFSNTAGGGGGGNNSFGGNATNNNGGLGGIGFTINNTLYGRGGYGAGLSLEGTQANESDNTGYGGNGSASGVAWRGGSGIVIVIWDLGLTTTSLSPENEANFSTTILNFSGNVTGPVSSGIDNVSLVVDGIIKETNISGIKGVYNFSNINLAQGIHNWTIRSFSNISVATESDSRNLTIDISVPNVTINFPNITIPFHEKHTNLTFNWSVEDSSITTCKYNYNTTNITVTCLDNTTNINITSGLITSLLFYVEDSFNNINTTNVSLDYALFLENETFDLSILEGASTTFTSVFITNGTTITIANLSYDSTENLGVITKSLNNYSITRTINSPSVIADINKSWFWNITNSFDFTKSLVAKNQTVLNFGVDNCSTNTNVLYNFTIVDEESQTRIKPEIENTTGKINLQIFNLRRTIEIQNFSSSYNNTNSFSVCLSNDLSSGEKYVIDSQIQYDASNHARELYNIQNNTLNSTFLNTNITLFDLLDSSNQPFKIIFKSSAFIPVSDAIIEIQRKYIDEGLFKIVEIPKTDGRGETIANLVLNDVIYNIVVKKFGETLATFNNIIAVCQTPLVSQCEIDLNAFSESIVIPDYESNEDFNFTLGYDNNTRIISTQFIIPSGDIATILLNVTSQDALGTTVCSDSLLTSSGTLTCLVPQAFGNSTITATLYKNGNLQAKGNIKLDQNPLDIYGVTLTGISLFLMLTLIGISISNNPVYTIISLMVGVGLLFAMNLVANNGFIGATSTFLWLVIAIIIILIKGVRRN